MVMNTTRLDTAAIAALISMLLGCSGQAGMPGSGQGPEESTAAATAATAASHATSLRVEQASRQIDLGRDVAGARAALEALVRDPTTTGEERDQASLALSRALDLGGERESAIRTLEDLLAAHVEDRRWPLEHATQDRLSQLLTGAPLPESNPNDDDNERAVAPFARVLT